MKTYSDVLKAAALGKKCAKCGREFTSVSQYRQSARGIICRRPCREAKP
jgi:bacterioferritin-associated ferredoxin